MRCDVVRPLLSELIDGELDDRLTAEVAGHLDACRGCATFGAQLAAIVDALHRLSAQRGRVGAAAEEHASIGSGGGRPGRSDAE